MAQTVEHDGLVVQTLLGRGAAAHLQHRPETVAFDQERAGGGTGTEDTLDHVPVGQLGTGRGVPWVDDRPIVLGAGQPGEILEEVPDVGEPVLHQRPGRREDQVVEVSRK